jgi:hypothetical protein
MSREKADKEQRVSGRKEGACHDKDSQQESCEDRETRREQEGDKAVPLGSHLQELPPGRALQAPRHVSEHHPDSTGPDGREMTKPVRLGS